jgi:hypothetical protein
MCSTAAAAKKICAQSAAAAMTESAVGRESGDRSQVANQASACARISESVVVMKAETAAANSGCGEDICASEK